MQEIKEIIIQSIKNFYVDTAVEVSRPDKEFGDFATNVAMQIAKKISKNPRQVAEEIKLNIEQLNSELIEKIDIAGPGFINIRVKDNYLYKNIEDVLLQGENYGKNNFLVGKTVLVEYLDPNPFKEIHIGHAYSGTVGDALASLFEASGAKVHRVTYQGDVGLHVAKAMYGILSKIGNNPQKLHNTPEPERPRFLGEAYAFGSRAYEESDEAKTEINDLNKKIYQASDSDLNQIHQVGVVWSMKYFEEVYKAFMFTPFEKNYLEGMVVKEGLKLVKEHIEDGIFEESDEAVIFRGEKYGLHTRVFINSQGLPTYEAKDLGNAMLKWRDYEYDRSIIITAEEQTEYFRVMLKALEQFAPEQSNATTHIPHGLVKLSTGKMSSRTGDVIKALDLLESAEQSAKKLAKDDSASNREAALAGIKYAFLKNRIGGDVVYDVEESLSLEGNSGPYIQYAHARACSILAKKAPTTVERWQFNEYERDLAIKISQFPEIVDKATQELMPHHICTYLYELAQIFNRFYEKNKVIDSDQESQRLTLVLAYSKVLKNGLGFLRIPAPERM